MLTTLRIRNLALVADLSLEFPPGLIAITGETGAGKSIIIGALNLLLGERADRTLIRGGTDQCTVEAAFDIRRLGASFGALLEECGIEPGEEDQLILKRTLASNGANRQFVNGTPTTLEVLRTLGEWLVDMHGPHDHQSLFHPAHQLAVLDAYGRLGEEVSAFGERVRRRGALVEEKTGLIVDERTYAQQLDLLRFQTEEISAARLRPDEEADLEHEYQRARNAAKILQLSHAALSVLNEEDNSILTQTGSVGRLLQELRRIDPAAECLCSLHEQAVEALHDLQSDLSHYADQMDLDPARLGQLEERLNLIHSLKRKYGDTLEEVLAFADRSRAKLKEMQGRDVRVAHLNAELAQINEQILTAGAALSAKRRKLLPGLSSSISCQLKDLGFRQSNFDILLTSTPPPELSSSTEIKTEPGLRSTGFDSVEFQFAPNPGEPARPLRAIASSGEIARVMLALKTVLAAEDRIPVLVFDEVDANVGGETANAVGDKMRQIAAERQVFCITHLPPIAAVASAHFVVTKQVESNRTRTEMHRVNGKERVTEIARMLGGQSEGARRHALELLRE